MPTDSEVLPKASEILLKAISEMTVDEIEQMTASIRQRRIFASEKIEKARAFVKTLSVSTIRNKLEAKIVKANKLLVRLDKTFQDLDETILDIRALRMQVE